MTTKGPVNLLLTYLAKHILELDMFVMGGLYTVVGIRRLCRGRTIRSIIRSTPRHAGTAATMNPVLSEKRDGSSRRALTVS